MVLEMWAMNEEKQQFNWDQDFRHDIMEELDIYDKLRKLYSKKIDYTAKVVKQRENTMVFEHDFIKLAKNPELLKRLKEKVMNSASITIEQGAK